MTEKKVKKNNWFKQFMIFLLVIVVAVSLGLIIFYFTQDGEKVTKNQEKVQVNAKNAFSIELTQEKYKASTKIEAEFDSSALSIPTDGITTRIDGKNKITTYTFMANAEDGTYKAGDYKIVFKTTAKAKASKELSVEVVVADGVSKAFFVGDAEQLKNIGSSDLYAKNKNYELTQDIDLKTLDEGDARTSWTPLAGFSGTLNGNGKKISNLYIDASQAGDDVGLFAVLSSNAKVYNIRFEDAQIISTDDKSVNAGIVAGQNSGTIERVEILTSNKGETKIEVGTYEAPVAATDVEQQESEPAYSLSKSVNVGAITGVLKRSNNTLALIDRVAVPETVKILVASNAGKDLPATDDSKDSYVGGIAGLVQNGTIYNSYVRGIVDVKGPKVFAGGIAGKTETRADLIQDTLAVTTNKKANIINSYTTAQVSTNQAENATIGAVIAKNKNLGLLSTVDENALIRTYVQDVAEASAATQAAVAGLTDQNFGTSISNKVATRDFLVNEGGTIINKNLNTVYENRFVGVYYKYANGDKNLSWYPGVSNANIAQDVNLAETNAEGAKTYRLVTSTMSGAEADYKTINYSKEDTTWDFDNIWRMGGSLPELRMAEYTTVLDVYDPQSAFDGDVDTVEALKNLDGKEGNFILKGNDPENDKIFRIKAEDNYEPIALKGNLFGNGVTIVVDYDSNKQFEGLFSTIAKGCFVQDLNITATVNTINKNMMVGSNKGFGVLAYENYGKISNVVVYDTNITLNKLTTKSKAIAAVAGYNEGTIENVRAENVKLTIEGDIAEVSVGLIAGRSHKGSIHNVETFNTASEIVALDKNANVTAGLIAGELSGQATISVVKAVGSIKLAADGKTYAGGIVGKSTSTGIIEKALVVEGAYIKANIAGGLVGTINNSDTKGNSLEAIRISQVNKNVIVEGANVGGFIGVMDKGIMRNSATYATLRGVDENSTISGFAYEINGRTNNDGEIDTCAQVYNVFASVVLDTSATTKAYKETTSAVRSTDDNNFLIGWARYSQAYDNEANPKKNKVAGYLSDCYFNSTLMGFAQEQKPANSGNETECGLSETDCKDANNFSDVFRTIVWTFESEQMPVLTFFTTAEFNDNFKVVVEPEAGIEEVEAPEIVE